MHVYNVTEFGYVEIHGPADLAKIGPGEKIAVIGEYAPEDIARWAAEIGKAVMRGVEVERL